jgi:hypothetical protein
VSESNGNEPKALKDPYDVSDIRIDNRVKQRKVVLMGDDGNEHVYWLKEITGLSRDALANEESRRLKTNDKGEVTGIGDFSNLMAGLISRCLFDQDGKRVMEQTIQLWPNRTQQMLHDAAQQLSCLGPYALSAEKEAKKPPAASAASGTASPPSTAAPSPSSSAS